MALSPKQKQFLKGLAHPLSPVVRVGRKDVSDSVRLAAASDSQVVALIGKTAILYRPRDEKPKIKLPV